MGKFYNITLGILTASIIALFILFFKSKPKNSVINTVNSSSNKESNNFPIAYFDVDSLSNNYEFSKLMQSQLVKLNSDVTNEVNKMQNDFDQKASDLQKKAQLGQLKPDEQEAAMISINKMRQEMSDKKEAAINNLQNAKQKFESELKKNIKDFILKYNSPQRYSFIIADEPGFIYYRDSMLNITTDILNGLNEEYKKKK